MVQKKRSKKEMREVQALFGLVELYLKTGKPVGSSTLQENGFEELSSATLRNYFAELERNGFLKQPHSSGGRIPTDQAFRFYAEEVMQTPTIDPKIEKKLYALKQEETKNVASYLQQSGEVLSEALSYPIFFSAVRFDHDFILDVKLVTIDASRLLCILLTSFGQVFTEIMPCTQKLSSFALKRIEHYFHWKLKNQKIPSPLHPDEESLAQKMYNEIMVRYLVRYSNYSSEEIHRVGFSKLLTYPEFGDPLSLTTGLSLFENTSRMRQFLDECTKGNALRFWIGSDIAPASPCAILAVPYRINHMAAGSIALLGPSRMPYRELFGALTLFSDLISETLTKSLYKFKLAFRTPSPSAVYLDNKEWTVADHIPHMLELKETP